MVQRLIKIILVIAIISTMLLSCNKEDKQLVIAEQFGLAYAPVQIMKEKGFLSEKLNGYEIEWVKLGNTTAIREAMIADKLDVGFIGVPPFLIGYDNEMEWGIFSGLSSSPLGLVSSDSSIKSLADIKATDRIVLPQPGSIQHILLSMASEKEFSNASKFDEQLVTMKHPDGMTTLLSDNEVNLHFTSPPYLFEELKDDSTSLVISGDECFGGDFTFIVGITSKELRENEKLYSHLQVALQEAIDFINNNKEESIEILSNYYDYDKEVLIDYIYNQNIKYTTEVNGLTNFIDFMHRNGYIDNIYNETDLKW